MPTLAYVPADRERNVGTGHRLHCEYRGGEGEQGCKGGHPGSMGERLLP